MHTREKDILAYVSAVLRDQSDPRLQVVQVMAYLHDEFPDNYWVGVYLLKDVSQELVLGPFTGPATDHIRIPVGRGVCGAAVAEDRNQRVDDVSSLGNYLACNVGTRSELVVLIREPGTGSVVGQIDIDGKRLAQFTREDEATVEKVAALIAKPVAYLAATVS